MGEIELLREEIRQLEDALRAARADTLHMQADRDRWATRVKTVEARANTAATILTGGDYR